MLTVAQLPARAVLALEGEEARGFLQGLVTANVERLAPGEAAFAALLSPQGKILFDFIVIAMDAGLLLDVRADMAEALEKKLKLYRLRAKIGIERRPQMSVAALWGDAPPEAADGAAALIADPRLAALGWRLVGPARNGEDEATYNHHRLSLGVPEVGTDFAADSLFLLDANFDALGGVDYKKGCFIGQEVSSRMKRKGDIRRRALIIEGAALEKGAAVIAGGSTLGETIAASGDKALALIRLDRLAAARESGAQISASGETVEITSPAYLLEKT